MIETEELKTLIPHRGKMMLLSRVVDYNIEGNIRAEYDITENCLFYDPDLQGVPAWAGFEFMSQAISALSGIRDRERGKKPHFGFILSIIALHIEIPVFKPGSCADIRMEEYDCTDQIYTFEGTIYLEGKKVMEGKLMVMEAGDEQYANLLKEYV